jgi:hypothetical protein
MNLTVVLRPARFCQNMQQILEEPLLFGPGSDHAQSLRLNKHPMCGA